MLLIYIRQLLVTVVYPSSSPLSPLSLSLSHPLSLFLLSLFLSLSLPPPPPLSLPLRPGTVVTLPGRSVSSRRPRGSALAGPHADRPAVMRCCRQPAAPPASAARPERRAPRELGANSARTRRELDAEVGRSAATRGRPARGRAQPTQQRLIVRLGVYGELGGGGGASSAAADGCFIGQLRRKAVSRGCPRTARRRQRPEER